MPFSILETSSSPSIRFDRCSALRRITRTALLGRVGAAALEQLRVAEDRVQRRADLVADADDVARLGEVGGFGDLLGLLQRGVGAPMRLDLLHQHGGLARRFGLGGAAALMRQHDQPGADAREQQQAQEHQPQRGLRRSRAPPAQRRCIGGR